MADPRIMEEFDAESFGRHSATLVGPARKRGVRCLAAVGGAAVAAGVLIGMLHLQRKPVHQAPVPVVPDEGPYPTRMKVKLPGLPNTGPYEYYSGYLNAGTPPSGRGTMYFHYICAMAPDWKNMPLTIWYNGGPGAPSTTGLFMEFGPYLLTEESLATDAYRSTGVPTPIFNPWTWANLSSLCEIDSPAPIGASFCTEGNGTEGSTGGPGGDAYSCGPWTDLTVAPANHRAHVSFFNDAFPEFEASQQPVSIAGESYAGIYVPLFVNEWLDDPIRGPNGQLINFIGFAIGDGNTACIPTEGRPVDWCASMANVGSFKYPNTMPGPFWDVEFFHGHSQMSEALYTEIKRTCSMQEMTGEAMPLGPECLSMMEKMTAEVGYYYMYNLLEACEPAEGRRLSGARPRSSLQWARRTLASRQFPAFPTPGDGDTGLGAPCLGSAMDDYFALEEVKRGLGIPPSNNFFALDNAIGFDYSINSHFVGSFYEKAIKAGKRVLVYESDTDAAGLQTAPLEDVWVPFFGNGTGVWTPAGRLNETLGLPMTQRWRPFSVLPTGRKVQGGYVMEWNEGQVSFVSIRGAGHLAPLYRPAASFTLFQSFLTGAKLPPAFYPA